jgi:hypothetical protein
MYKFLFDHHPYSPALQLTQQLYSNNLSKLPYFNASNSLVTIPLTTLT